MARSSHAQQSMHFLLERIKDSGTFFICLIYQNVCGTTQVIKRQNWKQDLLSLQLHFSKDQITNTIILLMK